MFFSNRSTEFRYDFTASSKKLSELSLKIESALKSFYFFQVVCVSVKRTLINSNFRNSCRIKSLWHFGGTMKREDLACIPVKYIGSLLKLLSEEPLFFLS